jgi:hypothetical protein
MAAAFDKEVDQVDETAPFLNGEMLPGTFVRLPAWINNYLPQQPRNPTGGPVIAHLRCLVCCNQPDFSGSFGLRLRRVRLLQSWDAIACCAQQTLRCAQRRDYAGQRLGSAAAAAA